MLHNKWRIDGRIARGGMGTVFAATHKNNGSTAAIKVLHQEFSRDHDTRSRFIQEGYASNQVSHPGVVRIIDDDETEEGLAYLVMELLEGELLEQRRIRKGGKLPLLEVYDVAEQLLDVLAAAHAKGIVHRDIKPENIFLTRQGRLKVLDFGFARMKTGFRKEQTATGFLLGTPGYMAPEQATGNRTLIDAQTDIWAVGATLFLLLSGQPVHEGESAAELLVAAANVPARSLATLEPGLPTKLRAAVDRALAFEKNQRWPDARSMQVAIRLVPGRPPLAEPSAERSKWGRSIPDGVSADRGEPIDEVTVIEHIEELDAGELVEGNGDAPSEARSPSDATEIMDARSFPQDVPIWDRAPASTGERRQEYIVPAAPRSSRPDAFSAVPPSRPSMPGGALPNSDRGHLVVAPPIEAPYAGAVIAPARRASGSNVLVFVLVAGVTMIVVILTGLLVILGSD
ncbi:MAG TPA: serine/threonine-protein kinase [Labilithrix sp.]|nr:serine/threonine-protein kinase [Labilithrix sp.]